MEAFVIDQPGYILLKSQFNATVVKSSRLVESFQSWGFFTNLEIYDASYSACWLTDHVFTDVSMAVRLKTFLMVVEMAQGKQYS